MVYNAVPILVRVAAWLIVGASVGATILALVRTTPKPLRLALLLAACWHLVLLAVVLKLGYGFFHVDDPVQYHTASASIADLWGHGVFPDPYANLAITSFGYYYWIALLYLVFGPHPIVPQLMNVLFGLLVGVLTYRVTKELGGSDKAIWWGAVAVLFYPTLAVWSVMLLKDIFAVLLLLLSIELLLAELRSPAPWRWPIIFAAGFTASTLRFYIGILILGIGIVELSTLSRRPRIQAAAIIVLAAAITWASFSIGEGPWYLQALLVRQARTDVAEALGGGGSGFDAPRSSVRAGRASAERSLPTAGARAIGVASEARLPLAIWFADDLKRWAWGPQVRVSREGPWLIIRSTGGVPMAVSPNLAENVDLRQPTDRARTVFIDMAVKEAECDRGQVIWRTDHGDFTVYFPAKPSARPHRFVVVAPEAVGAARVTALRLDPIVCNGEVWVDRVAIGGVIPDAPLVYWPGRRLSTWGWGPEATVTAVGQALTVSSHGRDPVAVSPPFSVFPDLAHAGDRARLVVLDMQVHDSRCSSGQVIWRTSAGDFTQYFTIQRGTHRYALLAPVEAGRAGIRVLRLDPLICSGRATIRSVSVGGLIPDKPLVEWSGDALAYWAWGTDARTANAGHTLAVRSAGRDPAGVSPNLDAVPKLAQARGRARILVLNASLEDATCRQGQVIWRSARGDFTGYFPIYPGRHTYVILAPLALAAAQLRLVRLDPLLCPGQIVLSGLSIGGYPTPGWHTYSPVGAQPGPRYAAPRGSLLWRVVRFFIVPLPSQGGTRLLRIGRLEWVIWWPLPFVAFLGFVYVARTSWRRAMVMFIAMVAPIIFYAYLVGNSGSLIRYRSMMFPLFVCLAAVGIDGLARRLRMNRVPQAVNE